MKDLYDFHQTKASQSAYFELITETYHKIYKEIGLKSYAVDASGGDFSDKFSREFQAICPAGEDVIIYSPTTGFACNEEIFEESKKKWINSGNPWVEDLKRDKSAEIGNIFDLGQKWVKAFDISYTDQNNQKQYPYMGCHGIGTSRCMGVIAEVHSDEKGLKWPESVAPFDIHLITNESKNPEINQQIMELASRLYDGSLRIIKKNLGSEIQFQVLDLNKTEDRNQLVLSDIENKKEVLWDDRAISLGQKFNDADLIGCPIQVIITEKSLGQNLQTMGMEIRQR